MKIRRTKKMKGVLKNKVPETLSRPLLGGVTVVGNVHNDIEVGLKWAVCEVCEAKGNGALRWEFHVTLLAHLRPWCWVRTTSPRRWEVHFFLPLLRGPTHPAAWPGLRRRAGWRPSWPSARRWRGSWRRCGQRCRRRRRRTARRG